MSTEPQEPTTKAGRALSEERTMLAVEQIECTGVLGRGEYQRIQRQSDEAVAKVEAEARAAAPPDIGVELREALQEWMAAPSDHVHPMTPAEERLMALARRLASPDATPAAPPDIDVERLADDVRYGDNTETSDFWRGFNAGIDALVRRLASPRRHTRDRTVSGPWREHGEPEPQGPTTEAGRELLSELRPNRSWDPLQRILAIEAEARAAAPPDIDAERLREALENTKRLVTDGVHSFGPLVATWGRPEDIAAEYRRLASPDAT